MTVPLNLSTASVVQFAFGASSFCDAFVIVIIIHDDIDDTIVMDMSN